MQYRKFLNVYIFVSAALAGANLGCLVGIVGNWYKGTPVDLFGYHPNVNIYYAVTCFVTLCVTCLMIHQHYDAKKQLKKIVIRNG